MLPSKQAKEKFVKYKDFKVKPCTIFYCINWFWMKYEIKIKTIALLSLGQEGLPMGLQESNLSNTRILNRMKHSFLCNVWI